MHDLILLPAVGFVCYYVGKHGLSTVLQTIGNEIGAIFHRTSMKEAVAELKPALPAPGTPATNEPAAK